MRYKEMIDEFKSSEKIWKKIGSITMACVLLFSAILLKNAFTKPSVSCDKNGYVKTINRKSLSQIEEYALELEIQDGEKVATKDVTIHTKLVNNRLKKEKLKEEKSEEQAIRDAEIDRVIANAEKSDKKIIKLPDMLEDGTKLKWKIKHKFDSSLYMIPVLYTILVLFIIGDFIGKKKRCNEILRNDIIQGLPRFTNQMLLMMNAGMILSDALGRICDSYEIIPEEERSFFENALVKMSETNADSRVSAAMLMNEFAGKYNIKELMRISTILSENEKRGSDIISKLTEESHFLWEERKIIAKEKGKLIDTKMAWPLGLLLILLIVITMAPALLTM